MKKTSLVFAALAVCLVANFGFGATVQLSLVLDPAAPACAGCTLSGAGTYNLFAEASADDNTGIAGYGISIQNVSSVLHRAPRVNSSEDSEGNINPSGFTLLRSANNAVVTGTGFLIGAGQDTVTPTPYLIQGFGQTAGSFAASLPAGNTNTGIIQPTWNGRLLLAEGAYAPGSQPFIDTSNIDVFVNVFAGGGIQKALIGPITPPNENPIVGDKAVDWVSVNPPASNSDSLPLADDGPVGVWSIDSFNGPTGPYSIDPSTGVFSWIGNGSPGGTYDAVLKYTDGGGLSDTGTLSIRWTVPEPSTFALFGLALVGFAGCRRK